MSLSRGTLEIQEENNYYPFGLKHKGYNNTPLTNHPYKFGGKELSEELGLNTYDFGARNYDAALGRWMNIDPLAELMTRHSPYNYAFDNPIYFIDADGMAPAGFGGVVNWGNTPGPDDDGSDPNCTDCSKCPETCEETKNRQNANNHTPIPIGDGGFVSEDNIQTEELPEVAADAPKGKNSYRPGIPSYMIGVREPVKADGIGVTVELAIPFKIPFTDIYGVGFSFGLIGVEDENGTKSLRGYFTSKVAIDPGISLGAGFDMFGIDNFSNAPLTSERLRGYGSESGGALIIGGSLGTDGVYFSRPDGTVMYNNGTYNIYNFNVGIGIDGFANWRTYTKISGN